MIKIIDKKDCCGCTACMAVCTRQAIVMVEDDEGFLYPQVNKNLCNDCGACTRVCPVCSPILEVEKEQKAILFQHSDANILKESTSGGLFSAIATWIIEKNGIVFGAAYDGNFTIRHLGVTSIPDLVKFRNSKYAQSEIGDTFSQVRNLLKEDKWVLFSGTPCQLEGLYKFLRKPYEKLVLVDVLCHSCPSPLVFRKYIEVVKSKSEKDVANIKFRDKVYGYNYSTMTFYDSSNKLLYKEGIDTDVMLRAFFNNISPRPSCYACSSKKQYHITDFSIWDCFDVRKFSKELDNDKGVTRALLHTDKARKIWNEIKDKGINMNISVPAAIQGVDEMFHSIPLNPKRTSFFIDLRTLPAEDVFNKYFPITFRHRLEKKVRVLTYRLGVYNLVKRLFLAIMGTNDIKR